MGGVFSSEDDENQNGLSEPLIKKSDSALSLPVTPGKHKARLFHDEIFSQLRLSAGIPLHFLDHAELEFRPGGGKGGTLMAFIGDSFIVKELSAGDHAMLLEITPSYFKHLMSGESWLAKIFLHYQDLDTGKNYFAMRNEIGHESDMDFIYDLKGCADDKTLMRSNKKIKVVHKRIWNVCMWGGQCAWSPERVVYHDAKMAARRISFNVSKEQRSQVLKALRRDTDWLAKHELMDYSLLVGVRTGAVDSTTQADAETGRQPLKLIQDDGLEKVIYLSVIDFLQKWNVSKLIAYYIKALERDKSTVKPDFYAERFYRHFENAIKATDT